MIEVHELLKAVRPFFSGHKSRLECLAMIVIGMIASSSVNLAEIAPSIPGLKVKHDSAYKRIQNFFAKYEINSDEVAQFIVRLFDFKKCSLIIDRTNWKLGASELNYLVLSVRYDNVSIPLFWLSLGKAGNSSTGERIKLLDRFIDLFGVQMIADICGDREFYGYEWLDYLVSKNIPYTFRLKRDFKDEREVDIESLFRKLHNGCQKIIRNKTVLGQPMSLVGYRDKNGDLTIIGTNHSIHSAMQRYIQRDQIEHMFRCMKTQGFNLEDTHITDPARLDRLFSVMSIAFVWAYKLGDYIKEKKAIPRKNHGRRIRTVMRTGLIHLKNIFSSSRYKFNELKAIIQLVFMGDISKKSLVNIGWI